MKIEPQITTNLATLEEPALTSAVDPGFSYWLDSLGISYKKVDFCLQVGDLTQTQGWILHLSAIYSHITNLLQTVIPVLMAEQVTFKIVESLATAEELMNGNLGIKQIGKIVTIYPNDRQNASNLATQLLSLTKTFKGPYIPTDICLGSIVFTRYGAFNPIIRRNEKGDEEQYIYDAGGNLQLDKKPIPFEFPPNVEWPFHSLAKPKLPDPPALFNKVYRIIDILKPDTRGNVFKGLYLKNLFTVKKCVLKQGFANSESDAFGRDIRDRLFWQFELFHALSHIVPMPKMYDFIQEDAYALLAMEYIEGDSLYKKQQSLNPYSKTWRDLDAATSQALINYIIGIAEIIFRMHTAGYIHRDIMPVNFLIDKRGRIYSIDLELTWSPSMNKPNPPFTLGTPGFASPEQMNRLTPDFNQDTYSLAALLVNTLTGITPIRFTHGDLSNLNSNLLFFIGDIELVTLLTKCLSAAAEERPTLKTMLTGLIKYRSAIQNETCKKTLPKVDKPNDRAISTIIYNALEGLYQEPLVLANNLWYSKRMVDGNAIYSKSKQYALYPGLAEGIAGPLYVLARLHSAGISIESHKIRMFKAWRYLYKNHLHQFQHLKPGLYFGAAGIAIALDENLRSGLLEENNQIYLSGQTITSLLNIESDLIDVATGAAGQGIAILRCSSRFQMEDRDCLLSKITNHLLTSRPLHSYRSNSASMNFSTGDAGVLWFLLEYSLLSSDCLMKYQLASVMEKMLKSSQLMKRMENLVATNDSYDLPDGGVGVILLLLKAYEVLGENQYKSAATRFLLRYPDRVSNHKFTQANGLAGLGELYLEAARITADARWQERALWIANVFIHSVQKNVDNTGYWVLEEHNPPTADLLAGMSGIIHFLARCLYPSKIGYRLLT